jgi:diadenosine tetraphosphate (Ap4A) HIT family hydrolase
MTSKQLSQYIASVRRIVNNIRRNASKSEKDTSLLEEGGLSVVAHVHVFVIPNYCESLPILQKTLEKLAAHGSANTSYVAVLAMEATEHNSREKAEHLKREFGASFREVLTTIHPADIPGEARGKGSNGMCSNCIISSELRYATSLLHPYRPRDPYEADAFNSDGC